MRLVVNINGYISGLTEQEEADRQELLRLALAGDSAGLRRAATRDSCDLPDRLGDTVLMWATGNSKWCDDEALWKKLLQVADPTCADTLSVSCLHRAARRGNSAAASALMDAGASVNAKNICEFTPLVDAAIEAPPDTAAAVSRVLLKVGSDWTLKNPGGSTALDLAIRNRKRKLAELLRGYEGKKYFDEPLALPLESDYYPVTNPQGFCLIINICNYEVTHDVRQGSEKDVERVKKVFEKLNFNVQVEQDLTAKKLNAFLSCIKRSRDLAHHGSFVCFLMAHGDNNCIYCSDGDSFRIGKITANFKASVCPRLAKKPKIFFIQACRSNSSEITDEAPGACLTPAEADFLVCFASTPGSVAFRDVNTGSIFVQTVCDFIKSDFRTCDLVSIMNTVSGHMQTNPVSNGVRSYPVAPQMVDQLSRKVWLDPGRAGNSG